MSSVRRARTARRYYVAALKSFAMDRKKSNAEYYARTRHRLILREGELRPSTILKLIDRLGELDLHPAGHRIVWLTALYRDLTGTDPPRAT